MTFPFVTSYFGSVTLEIIIKSLGLTIGELPSCNFINIHIMDIVTHIGICNTIWDINRSFSVTVKCVIIHNTNIDYLLFDKDYKCVDNVHCGTWRDMVIVKQTIFCDYCQSVFISCSILCTPSVIPAPYTRTIIAIVRMIYDIISLINAHWSQGWIST